MISITISIFGINEYKVVVNSEQAVMTIAKPTVIPKLNDTLFLKPSLAELLIDKMLFAPGVYAHKKQYIKKSTILNMYN